MRAVTFPIFSDRHLEVSHGKQGAHRSTAKRSVAMVI